MLSLVLRVQSLRKRLWKKEKLLKMNSMRGKKKKKTLVGWVVSR